MKERIDTGRSFNDPTRDREREVGMGGKIRNVNQGRGTCRNVSGTCRNVSEIAISGQMAQMEWMETGCVCISLSVSLFQHMSIFIMNVMVMRVLPRNQMCDCVAAAFLFFWLKGRMECMGIGRRFHDSAGGLHRTCGNVYVEQGVFAIQREVCTERVGTYAYGGAFPHLSGRVARDVSERIVFI